MLRIGKYSVKEWWQRFSAWQRTPAKVPECSEYGQHVCLNCGESYDGNYCTRCGQSAKTKRLTFRNALSNMLDVWGLGSRSMPRALWHLLFRPGYMIADYLRGHRQPYFPPFKMLFVLTATAMLLAHFLPNTEEAGEPKPTTHTTAQETNAKVDDISVEVTTANGDEGKAVEVVQILKDNWTKLWDNMPAAPAMMLLGWQLLYTLSTSVFFRKSPRMGKVTVTEQFYAQVLIAGQMQFLSIIYMLLVFAGNETYQMNVPPQLVALFALIDYKQLYGYGWWGTLWRSALTYLFTLFIIFLAVILITIFIFSMKY